MKYELSVLFIPFGTMRIAASRYRVYQYIGYLVEQNIKCKVFSIISDFTTRQMINSARFTSTKKTLYYLQVVMEKLLRFLPILILARKYNVIFLQRTTLPFGLEKVLRMVNKNIVFDLDDAIFLPDRKERGLLAKLKEYSKDCEVSAILKVARIAVVENEYIESYVSKFCQNIYFIPGPIDTVKNFLAHKLESERIIIGWIGSPSTREYLDMLRSVFRELSKSHRFIVKLVGAGDYFLDGVEIINVEWTFDSEVSQLQSFDIGVMPMPDNEWTNGKLGCKMLQYMAVGIPAVVSYTPTNAEVICEGENGMMADSEKEWFEKLSLLINDGQLRKKIGLNGRRTAEEKFSLKVNAPRLVKLFKDNFGD